jgi:ABC-type uncharacterized transport system permease subunit
MERIRLLPRLWNGGLGETVEVRAELLLVGVGAVLLALVIGATARTYFDVFVRTLVLSLFVDDQIDRFAQELMGSPGTIGESFARFLILLIWATIAWGIARWVRRRRLARPGSSGAA